MGLVDTHTHPHMEGYKLTHDEFDRHVDEAGLDWLICVGTNAEDSQRALSYAERREAYYASVGLHPHEARAFDEEASHLKELASQDGVVAVGECGLDYYYENSPRQLQQEAFRKQLELADERGLPLIFHVRDAFGDFFDIIDEYPHGRFQGVVHSFTADKQTLEGCLQRGFYIGLNGIMTFTKDQAQLEAARAVPLERLLLETDAPFLTPEPFRGTVNHSGHVVRVAKFLSQLRGEPLDEMAERTTRNAEELFRI